jgi:lia operon protein LiaG
MQVIVIPRLRRMALLSLTASFLPALPATNLVAQQAERYALTDDEVAIYNLAGQVQLQPGPSGEVTVIVTRGGADAAKLKVAQSKRDGVESLRIIYPGDRIRYGQLSSGSSTQLRVRDDGTFGGDHEGDRKRDGKREGRQVTIAGNGGGLDARANLRIAVPSGRQVSVHLAVGEVSVTNVNGDLHIDAASAPVTASNTRGELDIDVGAGPVQVTQSRGDLSVDTGSGGVTVSDIRGESVSIKTGSGDVTATNLNSNDLSIDTGSGDIQVTGLTAPQVALETGSGSVTADLSGEVWNVRVETGSGDVTLKVPSTLAAEVDIETSSGDIETDFEVAVTRHARDHMTGRIGEGGGKIAIETGSGGIKLVKRQ